MPKIIHTMVRVMDLDKSIRFYADALNLRESHRLTSPDFTLVYLHDSESGFEVELTFNQGRTEAYSHGTGYGHIAVVTDTLDADHARMAALGCAPAPIKEFKRGDQLLARFFFVQDPDGYKIEVLQRHGHYQ